MKHNKYEQTALFLTGTALGITIGVILAVLFSPQSGVETRHQLQTRITADSSDFSKRVRAATDLWLNQLQTITSDLAAQGKISAEEARSQIEDLLDRLKS